MTIKNKIKKLIPYYKPYKKILILDLIFSAFSALIAISIPIICQHITDKAIYLEKLKAIETIICLTLLIILLHVVFYFCKRYTEYNGKMFATKIEIDIETELFKHFQNQDIEFYSNQKIGKLMSYITNDAYNLSNVIKRTPEIILSVFIRFIGVFTFLFFKNKIFVSILLAIFILLFIFMREILPKVKNLNKSSREVFSNITSDLEENLSGIKSIKSFSNEKNAIAKFIANSNVYLETKNKMYKIQSVFDAGFLSFVVGLSPIITAVGAFFVINNSMTIGDIVAFILYVGVLESPLWDIINLNEFIREGVVGFNRIFDILEAEPQIVDSFDAITLQQISGAIEFKNVSFKYNKTSKNIIKNLSLHIKSGEYVALVGTSGVGKSTLCNLIPRFYDVFSGQILINGINVKNIKLENLRKNIGFVHQDTFLFSGTIMENIRFGKLDATDEEIIEAAKNAFAHDFIMNFSDGYNTQIGRRGIKLSGGQRQRLAIAQVFLKNPPILIFDEATSSLDSESERYIQKSMEKLAESRTTIVIAHRLSTIKNAKRILLMEKGTITEENSYEELLTRNGIYAEFCNLL